jgi:hypothetical protein
MWILRLNDMRSPKVEMYDVVARCEDNDKLERWVQLETTRSIKWTLLQ